MPRYANAPIIEAIIDIRVRMPKNASFEQLKNAQVGVSAAFPIAENLHESIVAFGQGPGPFDQELQRRTRSSPVFKSQDGRRIWQSRLDGFTFSQLKPYDTWNDFLD